MHEEKGGDCRLTGSLRRGEQRQTRPAILLRSGFVISGGEISRLVDPGALRWSRAAAPRERRARARRGAGRSPRASPRRARPPPPRAAGVDAHRGGAPGPPAAAAPAAAGWPGRLAARRALLPLRRPRGDGRRPGPRPLSAGGAAIPACAISKPSGGAPSRLRSWASSPTRTPLPESRRCGSPPAGSRRRCPRSSPRGGRSRRRGSSTAPPAASRWPSPRASTGSSSAARRTSTARRSACRRCWRRSAAARGSSR